MSIRFDFELRKVSFCILSKVFIKTEIICEIFKSLWMVDIQIKFASNDIKLKSDIALSIIFASKYITFNRKLIIDKGIWDDLKISVWVTIKQVPLSLLFSLNSNHIDTVFSKIRIIFMKDHSVGKIWLDLEFFIIYFLLFPHQHFLQVASCCPVHVNVCLTVL